MSLLLWKPVKGCLSCPTQLLLNQKGLALAVWTLSVTNKITQPFKSTRNTTDVSQHSTRIVAENWLPKMWKNIWTPWFCFEVSIRIFRNRPVFLNVTLFTCKYISLREMTMRLGKEEKTKTDRLKRVKTEKYASSILKVRKLFFWTILRYSKLTSRGSHRHTRNLSTTYPLFCKRTEDPKDCLTKALIRNESADDCHAISRVYFTSLIESCQFDLMVNFHLELLRQGFQWNWALKAARSRLQSCTDH